MRLVGGAVRQPGELGGGGRGGLDDVQESADASGEEGEEGEDEEGGREAAPGSGLRECRHGPGRYPNRTEMVPAAEARRRGAHRLTRGGKRERRGAAGARNRGGR
jgi:hypothetical protein